MAGKSPSWREVARILAVRLAWSGCDQHREHVVDCPFCEDVAAWETYARKAGIKSEAPGAGAPSVPLHELPLNEVS